jgi:phosphoglycolate phosphatase
MRTLMNREIQQITPFAGVEQPLSRLVEQGATLGLISSNSQENIQLVLGEGIVRLFAYRECGVSMFGKAVNLQKILRKSRIPPAAAIYIGDEIRDLEAARAVRIRFGAVAWGYTHLDALKARVPDEIFLHVDELAEHLI